MSTAWLRADSGWTLVRSPHFEVYSQRGESDARDISAQLERLRVFFIRSGALGAQGLDDERRVRVLQFGARDGYAAFRPRETADAFFAGSDAEDYIAVAPPSAPLNRERTLAHEYVHAVLHWERKHLPPWFSEGVAEVFSSVELGSDRSLVAGDLAARSQVLQKRGLLPLEKLLSTREDDPLRSRRDDDSVFYAQSWELVRMLLFTEPYCRKTDALWSLFDTGAIDAAKLAPLYGRSLAVIESDLEKNARAPKTAVVMPGVPVGEFKVHVSAVSQTDFNLVLAGLVLTSGDVNRAEAAYRSVQTERASDPGVAATLGAIALRKHDEVKALLEWKRAFELGLKDPVLCYQYAVLLENSHAPDEEIAAALRRAIELKPAFDDARYKLGLLESGRQDYAEAVTQLKAVRSVSRARSYGYWIAMASALRALGDRGEALAAAQKAADFARTPDERDYAALVELDTQTDMTVQFARDRDGRLQMVTSRKPHGATRWNPFIELGDSIQTASGPIHKVECKGGAVTGFEIDSAVGLVRVALTDPTHVLIEGGKAEFYCGASDGRRVTVQYAATKSTDGVAGIMRGMYFDPADRP